MTQTIGAVQLPAIEHGILVELALPDPTTNAAVLYRLSNCYTDIVYNGNTYYAAGGLLNTADVQSDLQLTNNEISISLSAIPTEYIEAIMGQEIKGGAVKVYRAFFDSDTQLIKVVSGVTQVFLRFNGIITNFAVQEDIGTVNDLGVTHTFTVTASSVLSVLENRISGRRTNPKSYNVYYAEQNITNNITQEKSMNRIVALKAASFDFGKPV